MIHIGLTATQLGGNKKQVATLETILSADVCLHHGDCIGGDAQAHQIMLELHGPSHIIVYPPENDSKRSFCKGYSYRHEPKPYLERNKDIVRQCHILVAIPRTDEEELRSGTWSTVRYARKLKKLVLIVQVDGSIRVYNG